MPSFPIKSEECELERQESENNLECLEDVDSNVIREYRELRKSVDSLENEVQRHLQVEAKTRETIDELKERFRVL